MKKNIILICSIIATVIIVGCLILVLANKSTSSKMETSEDVKAMFNDIYKDLSLPELMTEEVSTESIDDVKAYTGLSSSDNIEKMIVSEPLMNAQAYSAVALIIKDGADIEQIKQEMLDNINMRKWICVSAEELYITNNGNVIFMVMANEDRAKPVYDNFKKFVNNETGKELYRENKEDDIILPPETPVIE